MNMKMTASDGRRANQVMHFFVFVFCLSVHISFAEAATYYVSSSEGNDTNSGRSTSAPWKTLIKVWSNSSTYVPGDFILLKAGDSFDGPLIVNKSGSAGSPITIDRYGTGANPTIYGDHHTAIWSAVVGHAGVYSTALGTMVTIQSVYETNGNAYAKSTRGSQTLDNWLNTLTPGTWGYSSGVVYICTFDGNHPPHMYVFDQAAIFPNSKSYQTYQNLEIRNAFIGIEPAVCSHIVINNNYVHETLGVGIFLASCESSTISNNTVTFTGNDALYMEKKGNNWVHHNTCSHVGTNTILPSETYIGDRCGIGLNRGTNNVIEHNSFSYIHASCVDYWYEVSAIVRYNYGFHTGGATYPHGTGIQTYNNIFHVDGGGTGIHAMHDQDPLGTAADAGPNYVWNNVFYGLIAYGVYSDENDGVNGQIFRNNIYVTTNASDYSALIVSTNRFDSDYNTYYCAAGSTKFKYLTTTYTTLAGFQAASGQEMHSVFADPQFVSAIPVTAADFKFKSTSPCLNVGQDLKAAGLISSTYEYKDYVGILIPQDAAPDIGAFEWVSSNGGGGGGDNGGSGSGGGGGGGGGCGMGASASGLILMLGVLLQVLLVPRSTHLTRRE